MHTTHTAPGFRQRCFYLTALDFLAAIGNGKPTCHTRGITMMLVSWQGFFSKLPASSFVQEGCEGVLARLTQEYTGPMVRGSCPT